MIRMLSWYVFYLKDDSLPLPPLRLSLSPSWRSSGKGFAANALFFSQYVVSYIFTLKCRNDEWGCALYCCCMPSTDSVQIRSDQSSLATCLLLITLCFFPKWRKKRRRWRMRQPRHTHLEVAFTIQFENDEVSGYDGVVFPECLPSFPEE